MEGLYKERARLDALNELRAEVAGKLAPPEPGPNGETPQRLTQQQRELYVEIYSKAGNPNADPNHLRNLLTTLSLAATDPEYILPSGQSIQDPHGTLWRGDAPPKTSRGAPSPQQARVLSEFSKHVLQSDPQLRTAYSTSVLAMQSEREWLDSLRKKILSATVEEDRAAYKDMEQEALNRVYDIGRQQAELEKMAMQRSYQENGFAYPGAMTEGEIESQIGLMTGVDDDTDYGAITEDIQSFAKDPRTGYTKLKEKYSTHPKWSLIQKAFESEFMGAMTEANREREAKMKTGPKPEGGPLDKAFSSEWRKIWG